MREKDITPPSALILESVTWEFAAACTLAT